MPGSHWSFVASLVSALVVLGAMSGPALAQAPSFELHGRMQLTLQRGSPSGLQSEREVIVGTLRDDAGAPLVGRTVRLSAAPLGSAGAERAHATRDRARRRLARLQASSRRAARRSNGRSTFAHRSGSVADKSVAPRPRVRQAAVLRRRESRGSDAVAARRRARSPAAAGPRSTCLGGAAEPEASPARRACSPPAPPATRRGSSAWS